MKVVKSLFRPYSFPRGYFSTLGRSLTPPLPLKANLRTKVFDPKSSFSDVESAFFSSFISNDKALVLQAFLKLIEFNKVEKKHLDAAFTSIEFSNNLEFATTLARFTKQHSNLSKHYATILLQFYFRNQYLDEGRIFYLDCPPFLQNDPSLFELFVMMNSRRTLSTSELEQLNSLFQNVRARNPTLNPNRFVHIYDFHPQKNLLWELFESNSQHIDFLSTFNSLSSARAFSASSMRIFLRTCLEKGLHAIGLRVYLDWHRSLPVSSHPRTSWEDFTLLYSLCKRGLPASRLQSASSLLSDESTAFVKYSFLPSSLKKCKQLHSTPIPNSSPTPSELDLAWDKNLGFTSPSQWRRAQEQLRDSLCSVMVARIESHSRLPPSLPHSALIAVAPQMALLGHMDAFLRTYLRHPNNDMSVLWSTLFNSLMNEYNSKWMLALSLLHRFSLMRTLSTDQNQFLSAWGTTVAILFKNSQSDRALLTIKEYSKDLNQNIHSWDPFFQPFLQMNRQIDLPLVVASLKSSLSFPDLKISFPH